MWREDVILEDSSSEDSGSERATSQTSSAQVKLDAIERYLLSPAQVIDFFTEVLEGLKLSGSALLMNALEGSPHLSTRTVIVLIFVSSI